jgi:hypothetical protein
MGGAVAVGIEQAHRCGGVVELAQDEVAGLVRGELAVALAEGVVVETVEDVLLLDRRCPACRRSGAGAVMDHPVGAGDEQLGGQGDRLGVGHDPLGGFVQAEQDVHRDGPGDQRVLVVADLAGRVVGQEPGLDVAVHEEVAAQLFQQGQARAREGHVELDLEGRRGEHQAAYPRRVVMGPGGHQYRADALGQHGHVGVGDAVVVADVIDEGLHVAHRGAEARRMPAGAGRVAMAAGVPGEDVEIGQVQLVGQVGDAAGVFVARWNITTAPRRGAVAGQWR